MPNVTQSYAFNDSKNFVGIAIAVSIGSALLSTSAFAADPLWLTEVTTQLGAIPVMIGGVIVTGVAIYMAPIAWSKIKHAIGRS